MTYPTAEVCFEDKDFRRYYEKKGDEASNTVEARIKHSSEVFGYAARLKYKRNEGESSSSIFYSQPLIFTVERPASLLPFWIESIKAKNSFMG